MLQPDEVDYVIYHHPCSDGCGAAYVAWKYLTTKFPDRKVTYHGAAITNRPPDDLAGRNVLLVDYSYGKDTLREVLKKVNKLLIIDHHKSSEKDLAEIPDIHKIFKMENSGAYLSWIYFYPTVPPPKMILYIQDRDIWTKKLPCCEEFGAWFYTLPLEFGVYDKYADDDTFERSLSVYGRSYLELNNYYIEQALEYITLMFMEIKKRYYLVAYSNSSVLKSDIGNLIFTKYPEIDFSAVYTIHGDSTSFSLRSTSKHIDVSELSFSLGGGGHRNASGVKLPYPTNRLPGYVYPVPPLSKVYSGTYEEYQVVYLCSTTSKYVVGRYLLQLKYPGRQVAAALLDRDVHFDLAVVWRYDPLEDTTKMVVTFADKFPEAKKEELRKKLQLDDKSTFTRSGVHKFL